MDIHCVRQRTSNTLQRLVKMSFVPAGFWERFIARMLISLKEMDLQVLTPADVHQLSVAVNAILDFLMAWNVFFFLCSHLSQKGIQGTIAVRTLWSTTLLETSTRIAAAPSECDAARPSTGRRDCLSLLMVVILGKTWGRRDMCRKLHT